MSEEQVVSEVKQPEVPGVVQEETPVLEAVESDEQLEKELADLLKEDPLPGEEALPDKKTRYEKRVRGLVAVKKALEEEKALAAEEASKWRAETLRLARLQEQGSAILPKVEVDISDLPMPKKEDFDYDDDQYQAAISERAAIIAYRKEKAREQAVSDRQRQTDDERKVFEWQNQGRKKFADFDVALQGTVPITNTMANAIMSNDLGHDIAYFLGKNPIEAGKIASMHPVEQTVEIHKLATLVARKKLPKTESTAPSPTSPVGDREVVTKPVDIYDPKISFDDYEKIRMKQIRDRYGAA